MTPFILNLVLSFDRLELSVHAINPLNAELNPICHLLALLAHPILHVSGIKVKACWGKEEL